jgi:two-component system phosphate regulon sensor histidine kinase PhoR
MIKFPRLSKKSLTRHYVLVFSLILIGLAGLYLYIAHEVEQVVYRQSRSELASVAGMLLPHVPTGGSAAQEYDRFCKLYGSSPGFRITMIAADGTVLGDSEYDTSMMNNHSDRPEVMAALRNGEGFSTRFSVTLNRALAYYAISLGERGGSAPVFRISRPLADIKESMNVFHKRIILFLVTVALIFGLYGYNQGRRMGRIFETLADTADRINSGVYKVTVDITSPDEARVVAEKLNRMAKRLDDTIAEITARNAQFEGILTNMVEPVLLLDRQLRIRHINRAALKMLNLEPGQAEGRSLMETFRNSALHDFAREVMGGKEALETGITLTKNGQTVYLQVHGTLIESEVLRRKEVPQYGGERKAPPADKSVEKESVLLVFNDITRIKNLEKIRQDFVANVSHELKTPITSITGFVETLLHGALENRDEALQFLNIIDKQTRRMNSIIDDLLSLSKLENLEQQDLEFDTVNISGIISSALQICRVKAEKKETALHQLCEEKIQAEIIPLLIEQALVNIIDNAIKYSDSGEAITVSCTESENYVNIAVEDSGCGIPEQDLPRIFERFYRVDKARSREMGGTGLGLSITKHIIRVNNGTIRVTSDVGVGTTFYITLPKHQQT